MGLGFKKHALLIGANSQVCQGWLERSKALSNFELFHLSRSPESLSLQRSKWLGDLNSKLHSSFEFDLVVNFVGASNPSQISGKPLELIRAMQKSDDIGLHHARRGAHYIFLSTGAVHDELPSIGGPVKSLSSSSMYVGEKKRSEIAHAASDVRESCADLRIFGFVSDPRDAEISTLIGSLWKAFNGSKRFVTSSSAMIRDFWGNDEAAQAIDLLLQRRAFGSFDAFSASPASKTEIAEFLGLKIEVDDSIAAASSPTGSKADYFSLDRSLSKEGFIPIRTAQEIIREAFISVS